MDEALLNLQRPQEAVRLPEREETPSAKIKIADQNDYQYANQKEKIQSLEDAEKKLVNVIVEISGVYDRQAPTILGENFERRTNTTQQLDEQFEDAVRNLNPKGKQLSSKSGSVEVIEPREPLEYEWRYGNKEEYQRAREKYGHAGFLALRLIENTSLKKLNEAWTGLDKVRRDIGLASSWNYAGRSPYLQAEKYLKGKLEGLEIEELDVIVHQTLPQVEFGSPKTPQEARQKVLEKMERDLPFSVVKEKYDAGVIEPSVYREIHTFTKDPKTGIRFITQRGFKKSINKEEFELWGTIGISGFGPNGEIYSLTPQYYGPAYSVKSDESWDSFKPPLAEDKQIKIWEAYCRAECDIEATQKDFRRDSDWRYNLEEIYWGNQMEDMERYKVLSERLKIAKLLKDADASDFGKVRLGIRLREGNMAESGQETVKRASEEQLKQIRDLFEKYWQNPQLSKLVTDKGVGFLLFDYPYASDMSFYPDDYEKTIKLRLADLSQSEEKGAREILIRDAYDEDGGLTATKYLKVSWDKAGNWKIERGRHSHTNDAYFLQPEETKNSLTQKDAETVSLALGLLSQPRQKRS